MRKGEIRKNRKTIQKFMIVEDYNRTLQNDQMR